MKKAIELENVETLGLSNRTVALLKRYYSSVDQIVKQGRVYAYEEERGICRSLPKYKEELVSALRNCGFTRPAEDFVMSFNVATLYSCICLPGYVAKYDYSQVFIRDIESLSNEQYESFKALTEDEIKEVERHLQAILTEREFKIVYYSFGLDGANTRDLEAVVQLLNIGIGEERTRQIECKALRKLSRSSIKVPAVFDMPDRVEEIAGQMRAELEELMSNPIFAQANDLIHKLKCIGDLPFRHDCECMRYGSIDYTPIENIDLSVRAYNCLKRAHINYVADIIKRPNDDWFRIQNLGMAALKEVIAKMHSLGYKDFKIEFPEIYWPV